MKMKLSKFLELIQVAVDEAREKESEHHLPIDPDIIFSMGKPTDGKLIEPQGMGTAGDNKGDVCFFIDFQPKANMMADLENAMREILGDEKADKIISGVKESIEKDKEKASEHS